MLQTYVFGNPASFVFLGAFSQAPRPRFMQGYQFSCGRLEMTPTITGPRTVARFQWIKVFFISYYNTVDNWWRLISHSDN
jgi:hypothetical protein